MTAEKRQLHTGLETCTKERRYGQSEQTARHRTESTRARTGFFQGDCLSKQLHFVPNHETHSTAQPVVSSSVMQRTTKSVPPQRKSDASEYCCTDKHVTAFWPALAFRSTSSHQKDHRQKSRGIHNLTNTAYTELMRKNTRLPTAGTGDRKAIRSR